MSTAKYRNFQKLTHNTNPEASPWGEAVEQRETDEGCSITSSATAYAVPPSPQGEGLIYWGLTTRLTILPLTTMVFTSCMPSRNFRTFSSATATATTASLSASAGTMMLARTLPLT